MSRPKSLDQEIRRDLKILAFLNSLSRSRVSQFYKPGGLDSLEQSRSRTSYVLRLTFENRRDQQISIEISQFVNIFGPDVPQKVSKMSRSLNKSRSVSTNLDNLSASNSQF
jgi:hypothetical protein